MIDVTPADPWSDCRAGQCTHVRFDKCPFCDLKRHPSVAFEFNHGLIACGCGYRATPKVKATVKPNKNQNQQEV